MVFNNSKIRSAKSTICNFQSSIASACEPAGWRESVTRALKVGKMVSEESEVPLEFRPHPNPSSANRQAHEARGF